MSVILFYDSFNFEKIYSYDGVGGNAHMSIAPPPSWVRHWASRTSEMQRQRDTPA